MGSSIQPVEETGLVIKVRGRNFICLRASPFLPDTRRMLPVGVWNESDTPTLFSPFSFLCTTCSSNRPVADAIGFPFFSRPCIITLILICCHPPSPLLRFVQSLSPIRTPSHNLLSVTPPSYLPSPPPFFTTLFLPISYQPHRDYLQPDLKVEAETENRISQSILSTLSISSIMQAIQLPSPIIPLFLEVSRVGIFDFFLFTFV